MGTDKTTTVVAGRPMLDWVGRALTEVCVRVVVAGGRPPTGWEHIPDTGTAHRGPLAGVVSALDAFPNETLAVVAVDQPWVRASTIARLGEFTGDLAIVPVDGGVRQTTCAVYPPNVGELARDELAGGGSLQSVLDVASFSPVIDWPAWGEDGRSWYSADTPEALAAGLDRFGTP